MHARPLLRARGLGSLPAKTNIRLNDPHLVYGRSWDHMLCTLDRLQRQRRPDTLRKTRTKLNYLYSRLIRLSRRNPSQSNRGIWADTRHAPHNATGPRLSPIRRGEPPHRHFPTEQSISLRCAPDATSGKIKRIRGGGVEPVLLCIGQPSTMAWVRTRVGGE